MRNKKQNGFTLIEIIISISIMTILTSLVLVNFSSLSTRSHFNTTVDTLVSDLHKAQSLSLSSRDIDGMPSSAYGLIFQTGTPGSYEQFVDDREGVKRSPKISVFPKRIYVREITVVKESGVIVRPTTLTVRFQVPYGRIAQTYAGATDEVNSITTMVLSTEDGSRSITVTINGITGNVTLK